MVSSMTMSESDECLLIRSADFLNISSTGIFLRNLFRFDWLVCSRNMPFMCATERVGDTHDEEMYLENCLNCLLSKRGLNSVRRSVKIFGGFTIGISIIV